MFIDQFGIGNIMMPVQRYQPIDPGRPQQQRMLTPNRSTAQGYTQDLANPFGSGTSAVASGAPPSGLPAPATAQAPAVPPGWSTPPFNPNGTVQPAGAPAAPAAAPEPPAEPVTVDQGGTVIPEPPLTTGPGVFQLKEGPTTADRMRAGFMMLAAAGQSNFAQVAGTVNAGLAEKQQQADQWNQTLLNMAKPRYEEATDKDGRIIRKTYPAQYSYDATTGTVREVPGAAAQAPKIEVLYDPTKGLPPASPGGASAWREADYIKKYQEMPEAQQLAFAETQGIKGRPLNEFELITLWNKNSAGNAAAIASATKGADIDAAATTNAFIRLRDSVEYIDDDLAAIDDQIKRLNENSDRGGIFQPIEQFANQVLAEFGMSEEALRDATNEQILESQAIQNMMGWFREQGLGARGLDTPAEFRAWLQATGGNLSMTNEAALHFLEKRREGMLQNVDRYNRALTDPKYRNVPDIGDYRPLVGVKDRHQKNTSMPPPPPGAVLDGQ